MIELRLIWILASCLIGVSLQQCTLDMFRRNVSHNILNSFETTWRDPSINITSTYYNCLSRSDTSDHYSSMSVSILYIRSDDPNNTHEVRYNLQCINRVWEIVGNQSTALRNNYTRYCDDCTDQTVKGCHCTGLLIVCNYSTVLYLLVKMLTWLQYRKLHERCDLTIYT